MLKAVNFGRSNQGQGNNSTPAKGRVGRRGRAGPSGGLDIGVSIHRLTVEGDVEHDSLNIVGAQFAGRQGGGVDLDGKARPATWVGDKAGGVVGKVDDGGEPLILSGLVM